MILLLSSTAEWYDPEHSDFDKPSFQERFSYLDKMSINKKHVQTLYSPITSNLWNNHTESPHKHNPVVS